MNNADAQENRFGFDISKVKTTLNPNIGRDMHPYHEYPNPRR